MCRSETAQKLPFYHFLSYQEPPSLCCGREGFNTRINFGARCEMSSSGPRCFWIQFPKENKSISFPFSMQIASSLFLFFFLEKLILAVQKTITEDISLNTSGSPTPAKQGTCLHRVLYWKRRNICYVRRHLLM